MQTLRMRLDGWLPFASDATMAPPRPPIAASLLTTWPGFTCVLYTSGYVFTAEQFAEQLLAVQRSLRSYQWLAYNAKQAGGLMWNIIPKFHYWAELALQARCFNPRWCQCYRGESLIGRVMPWVSAGLNGPFRDTIQARVLEKYLVAFEVQITNLLEIWTSAA